MPYDHADVHVLVGEVQQEYVRRYGGEDSTPLAVHEFAAPDGVFLVAYADGLPVAMGGWRRHDEARDGRVPSQSAAEIKRMYVTPTARGRGIARVLLAELERTAAAAGCDLMVLETGEAQPEAIAAVPVGGLRRHRAVRALPRRGAQRAPRQGAAPGAQHLNGGLGRGGSGYVPCRSTRQRRPVGLVHSWDAGPVRAMVQRPCVLSRWCRRFLGERLSRLVGPVGYGTSWSASHRRELVVANGNTSVSNSSRTASERVRDGA